MLSMALPIALVALMRSERWRDRILYGLAACALVAATFATLRKSAILAPISVFATLAYFRRRELVRLAPLAVVLIVVVSAVSPGALGSTVSQFTRSDRSEVATVSDRTADYDAIRPDLWSHLAFGRGWGAYNHESYRILDSEILHRILEMGVIGLIAYLMLPITVVLATRRTIAERDPVRSPQALVGAAAAVCFSCCPLSTTCFRFRTPRTSSCTLRAWRLWSSAGTMRLRQDTLSRRRSVRAGSARGALGGRPPSTR